MANQPQNFPSKQDSFEAVMNGQQVVASHINDLATAATEIEKAAKNIILTEKAVQTNGTTVRRRKVIFDTFVADSHTPADKVDIDITIRDADGNPIAGAWKSLDYAITLETANLSVMPNMPTSLAAGTTFDTSKSCQEPHPFSIIGYKDSDATATVRIFNNTTSVLQPPYMVKIDPENKYIWALCGSTLGDMHIHRWDAVTKQYIGGYRLTSLPTGYASSGTLIDNVRDFQPTTSKTYVLFRKIRVEELGKVAVYDLNGKCLDADWFSSSRTPATAGTANGWAVISYLSAMTALAADPSGNLYVGGFMRSGGTKTYLTNNSQDNKSAQIMKFNSSGQFVLNASSVGPHTAEDKIVGGSYGHKYGNGFLWSWCFGLSYCPTDGYIYGSFHTSHRTDSNGLNAHTFVMRYTTSLTKVAGDYRQIYTDRQNHQLGLIAPYFYNNKVYLHCLHPYADYGSANKDDVVVSTLEAFAAYPAHRIHRWNYTDTTVNGDTYLNSMGFDLNVDQTGVQMSAANIVTGLTISNDGLLYYCTSGRTDRIHCVTAYQALDRTPLTIPGSRIMALVRVTVVTATNSSNDLRPASSGNIVVNAAFTGATTGWIHDMISPNILNDRTACLLRDKPGPSIDGSGGAGWGYLHVEDPAIWRDESADELLANCVTDPYGTPDSSSGVTKVTTGSAAVTRTQLGFVRDPNSHSLYIPATWFGDDIGAGKTIQTAWDLIDHATSDYGPDTTAKYISANGSQEVKGSWGVPVMEVNMPRTWESGDELTLGFKYSLHLLDRIQNHDYDKRVLRGYAFIMFLDGSNKPILPVTYDRYKVDGVEMEPVYRLDYWTPALDTENDTGNITAQSTILPASHLYKLSASSLQSLVQGPNIHPLKVPIPEYTTRIRMGFVCACYSKSRPDNILTYPGESGGMYVDDVSLVVSNPSLT